MHLKLIIFIMNKIFNEVNTLEDGNILTRITKENNIFHSQDSFK